MTTRTCGACGGPLRTIDRGHDVTVVVCAYCGAETSLASKGAEQAARALEAVGLRLPERPMSREQIDDELQERAARERERVHQARIVAGIVGVLALAIVGLLVALS